MKRPYKDTIYDKISQRKKEIDKYIIRLGERNVMRILQEQFALSRKDSSEFIRIIQDMVCGLNYEALPCEWFFRDFIDIKNHTLTPLTKYAHRIRREGTEISHSIEQFRKLPDDVRDSALERWWPKEYLKYLQQEGIDRRGKSCDQFNVTEITNIILAKRYGCEPNTIETYRKPSRQKRTP